MATELPEEPKNRKEQYLADIAGQDVELPVEPKSREEQYLAYIAENGGGGGGGGTSNFNQLSNRPKYNGATMTGDTNIPEVKTYTAGSNITISGNEISATDTKYTAGTGLNLTGTEFSADTTVLATQNDLSSKQNTLTAGSNITISDNTISATDTTYSAFTGTDGTAAGTAGLVPAPATTDAGKFLKADGTWDTAGGGSGVIELTSADYNANSANWTDTDPTNFNCIALWKLEPGVYYSTLENVSGSLLYVSKNNRSGVDPLVLVHKNLAGTYAQLTVIDKSGTQTFDTVNISTGTSNGHITNITNDSLVQSTGTSTNAVMSQNAVTSMVFADPSTRYAVRIGTTGNTGAGSVALGYGARAQAGDSVAIGASTDSGYPNAGTVAIGYGAKCTANGQFDISLSNIQSSEWATFGYNSSQYRLLTGLYDGQSAHDAATVGQAVGTTETYTIVTSDWSALSSSSPYTYQATVTATYTIGNSTVAELLNDSPVDFATYGFAIGSISSQSVTIYSIGQPSASVSLKINYKG